jgi:hypothetical protein
MGMLERPWSGSLGRLVSRVRRSMWFIWLALLVCGAAVPLVRMRMGTGWHAYTLGRFDLDLEGNIPAWFSGALLLLAAFLLAILALRAYEKTEPWRGWRFLSLGFLYLSMDEVAGLHEMFLGVLGRYGLYWFHPWIIPAAILLPLLLWKLKGFLRVVNQATRSLFLTSGTIYVTGTVVIDALGRGYRRTHGEDLVYFGSVILEEALEGLGLVLLNSHLLNLIREEFNRTGEPATGNR